MVKNLRLIKILKIIAFGLMFLVALTIILINIEPGIEFPSVEFNRLWGFLICFFCLIYFFIIILISKSFNRIFKWILIATGIPIIIVAIFYILIMYAKIEYQPHYDRYKVYQNLNVPNQYIVVQDYTKWKSNLPAVDTTLIDDYSLVRKRKYLNSLNVKGTWIKLNETGKVIDTLIIK